MVKKTDIREKIEYLKKDIQLSNDEIRNAAKFILHHRKCKTICQSIGQTKYCISFHECSIGSWVTIICGKCHVEMDISDKVRSNW